MKIKYKILLSSVFISFLAILISSISIYYSMQKTLKTNISRRLITISDLNTQNIEQYFRHDSENLALISNKTQLKISLDKFNNTKNKEEFEKLKLIITNTKNTISNFNSISLLNLYGKVIISTDSNLVGKNFANEEIFERGKKEYITNLFSVNNKKELLLHFAAPLILKNKLIGVIYVIQEDNHIHDLLNNFRSLGKSGYAEVIIKRKNDYIVSIPKNNNSDIKFVRKKKLNSIELNSFSKEKNKIKILNNKNQKEILISSFLIKEDISIIIIQNYTEAYSDLIKMKNHMIIILLLSITIIFIISWIISGTISKPIQKITFLAKEISKGNFNEKIDIKTKDEIGNLAVSFNKMIDDLKFIFEEQKTSEEKFRLAFETIPDVFTISNLQTGEYVDVNNQFVELTGYLKEEVIGKTAYEINIWENIDDRNKLTKGLIEKGTVEGYEAKFKIKNGSIIYGFLSATIIKINDIPYIITIVNNITELVKSRKKLEESEEKYKILFEKNHTPVLIINPLTAKIKDANTAASKFYGWSHEELIAMKINQINTLTEKEIREELEMARTEKRNYFQFKHRLADNSIRVVEEYSDLITIENHEYLYSIIHDVTENKKAELTIKENQSKINSLINNRDESIWSIDANYNFITFNKYFADSYKKFYGIDLKPGINSINILSEKIYPLWKKKYDKALQGEKVVFEFYETILEKKYYFEVFLNPIIVEEKTIGVSALSIDITERKEAETKIKKLTLAVQQNSNIIVITDLNGTIEYVNPSFSRVTGYSFEEIVGKSIRILKSGNKTQKEYQELWGTIKSGKVWKGEFLNKKKNGELYYEEASIFPLLNEKGKLMNFVAIKEDITERKKTEEEIRKLNENLEIKVEQRTQELQNANKEMQSFIYSISHDLRAPLRSINGFSEILYNRHKNNLNQEGQEYLAYILEAGKNMTNLIEDLLKFSRLIKNNFEKREIDLKTIFETVINNLNQDIIDEDAEIILPENYPTINSDFSLLSQIFTNLIDNSIKYHKKNEKPIIEIRIEKQVEQIIISIKDNGIGIKEEFHEKIFNIFQRLHSSDEYSGTGIGLAIVKKAISYLNGKIFLKSEINKGTTFFVYLPK